MNWLNECNAMQCLIGKKFVINTHSFSCNTFNQSAFFKAGIFVLQLNLLCCPCFARTPMQYKYYKKQMTKKLVKLQPQLNDRVIPFLLICLKKRAGARPNSKGAEAYQGAKT